MPATWNLSAPPGFQGLRDDLDLSVYESHLPHWRQDGAMYFVTFRLQNSVAAAKTARTEASLERNGKVEINTAVAFKE